MTNSSLELGFTKSITLDKWRRHSVRGCGWGGGCYTPGFRLVWPPPNTHTFQPFSTSLPLICYCFCTWNGRWIRPLHMMRAGGWYFMVIYYFVCLHFFLRTLFHLDILSRLRDFQKLVNIFTQRSFIKVYILTCFFSGSKRLRDFRRRTNDRTPRDESRPHEKYSRRFVF